jgi:hypothetical protein
MWLNLRIIKNSSEILWRIRPFQSIEISIRTNVFIHEKLNYY